MVVTDHGFDFVHDFPLQFPYLGKAGPSMQQDFYTVEHLATQLLSSATVNLNNIPDYRLRPMLHILSKVLENPQRARRLRQELLTGTRGGRTELRETDGVISIQYPVTTLKGQED